ncbi:MAG: gliding motility-associated ABC transporter ATP-binding subunit GldA [Flavobacteriales bacterium]
MSIRAENITKIYGKQKALDDVSFDISPGEVVGFLGPNGAGKSTMMKILTGFIPQNKGKAFICGIDVEEHPLRVKRSTGYLPEHNPLYPEMYVREYLSFIAGLHRIPAKMKKIEDIIELVGLAPEKGKKIGALSRGFRQRVGLAQALIHDPEVLILDEPTTGLDPNQIIEIRQIIKEMGKKKTVMLSTHIMQEVEAICDRVIIINKGQVVADDSAGHIMGSGKQFASVVVEFDQIVDEKKLLKVDGVESVEKTGDTTWQIRAVTDKDIRKAIFDFAVANEAAVLTIHREEYKLEDIFRKLTDG